MKKINVMLLILRADSSVQTLRQPVFGSFWIFERNASHHTNSGIKYMNYVF